jgi:hypothetical protein
MGISKKEISVLDYLKLLRDAGVSSSKAFALVNQDVYNGEVYFRTAHKLKAFEALLHASETGFPPETEVYRKKVTEVNWDKETDGLDIDTILACVENIRGPGHDGFYTGRCPSCAKDNRDSDSNHFRFNPEEMVIHCFAGCNRFQIVEAIK